MTREQSTRAATPTGSPGAARIGRICRARSMARVPRAATGLLHQAPVDYPLWEAV